MLSIRVSKNWVLDIQNPKLLLINVITTWVTLFLYVCGLLPEWWYTLMTQLGGGSLW